MRFLSQNKMNIMVQRLFGFADFFCFAHLPLTLPWTNRENDLFVKLFSDGMWEKVLITDTQRRQENPKSSGPPFQWETRQASFTTGMVDPRVRIFLSPLNTTDVFCLSGMLEKLSSRPAKTQISLGIFPVCSEFSFSQIPSLIWVFAGRRDYLVGFVMLRIIWYKGWHLHIQFLLVKPTGVFRLLEHAR